ncbi:MAG: hypothetical protein VX951_12815 [Planctomycetota bacterium]|nr:hypothetical protein [Planctomycetota bacterium]
MNRITTILIAGLVATPAMAQESLQIKPASKGTLKYSIQTKSEIKTARKMLVDGEERSGGRNRGGGNGITKTSQKLVFEQGPVGANWRNYITAEGQVSRDSDDGEGQTSKIVGALHGKKVSMQEEGGRLIFKAETGPAADGADDSGNKAAGNIPRNVSNGVSANVDLSALGSAQPVAVDSSYDISAGLVAALKSTLHPVRAARASGPQGNRSRQAGQKGSQKGGQKGSQKGNRRSRQQRARTPATFNDTALRLVSSEKAVAKATGTLVSIVEKDGQKFATVAIKGTIVGEGTPTETGLSRGRGNRRSGQGQRSGGSASAGEAKVSIGVTGTLVINQTEQRVETLDLDCKIETSSKTERTSRDRKMETTQSTSGQLGIRLSCASK